MLCSTVHPSSVLCSKVQCTVQRPSAHGIQTWRVKSFHIRQPDLPRLGLNHFVSLYSIYIVLEHCSHRILPPTAVLNQWKSGFATALKTLAFCNQGLTLKDERMILSRTLIMSLLYMRHQADATFGQFHVKGPG